MPTFSAPLPVARFTGALYLIIIAGGLFGELGVRAALVVQGDAPATAANLLASEGLFRLGFVSDLVIFLADVAVAALLAISACGGGSGGESSEPLPDVALTELTTGEPTEWNADGKPMVVNLWASWCAPCRTEMPDFEEVYQELGDQLTIVGVTDERKLDAALEAADAAGVTYPLLVDEDQRLLIDLGITGMPGKCPVKCGSLKVTFLMPVQPVLVSMSITRSTNKNG